MFFEPKRRYWQKSQVNLDEAPMDLYSARVVREGTDVTIATYGPMVHTSLQAAEVAAAEGVSIEVIDLRSLSPIDYPTIIESVKKTGRLITVSEAPNSFSIASELSAKITEECFYNLQAPVLRVGGFDIPYPAAKLEEIYLPDADRILEAVDRSRAY
jgi:pyruvate dehydrogenase E1 component beta subunit